VVSRATYQKVKYQLLLRMHISIHQLLSHRLRLKSMNSQERRISFQQIMLSVKSRCSKQCIRNTSKELSNIYRHWNHMKSQSKSTKPGQNLRNFSQSPVSLTSYTQQILTSHLPFYPSLLYQVSQRSTIITPQKILSTSRDMVSLPLVSLKHTLLLMTQRNHQLTIHLDTSTSVSLVKVLNLGSVTISIGTYLTMDSLSVPIDTSLLI